MNFNDIGQRNGEDYNEYLERIQREARDAINKYTSQKGKEDELNDCLCCKGVCDCEYGCHHIHNLEEDKEEKNG